MGDPSGVWAMGDPSLGALEGITPRARGRLTLREDFDTTAPDLSPPFPGRGRRVTSSGR